MKKYIEWRENWEPALTVGLDTPCFECISHCRTSKDVPYIRIKRHGLALSLHRYIYEEMFGQIPKGLFVCHKCDNPLCINPEHLQLGTAIFNIQEMITRNRNPKGETHGSAKITESMVLQIRADAGSTLKMLAEKFHISDRTVSDIKLRKRWKHIP